MNPINQTIKLAKQEVGVASHVPITHFNSPTILESQTGAMFSVIKCQGVPFATTKAETLNHYKHILHAAIAALDERFCILGTVHRHKIACGLSGKFNNNFADQINNAYMQQFKNQSSYQNDLYLVIIYKGFTSGKVGKISNTFKKISRRYIKHARQAQRELSMQQLNQAVQQLITSLAEFGPQLLGENDPQCEFSELLTFVSLFINGGEAIKFKKLQQAPVYCHDFVKSTQVNSFYPKGNLAHYLSSKRIFFGETIQFQGANPHDSRFAAIISIKRYVDHSASIMLDPLLHLDFEFISSNSFIIENKFQADKSMQRQANKMQNAGDPALTQIEDLTTARDLLASDHIIMGYHHNSVMIFSDSLTELEQHIANAITCYQNAGIVAVRETIAQEPMFWAQIPTNINYIARMSLISSQNFVDFFPLHNYHSGYKDNNHLGSALTLVTTPAKTPLWFNLHAKGPKDNPAPGHATIIGGNGSGKTVAMCFFDAQLNRYAGNSFCFDRNRGMEIYIRASGGYYAILSPQYANDIAFNPLQLPDTPINRKFCKAWLVQLVKKEQETEVEEAIVDQLNHCVDYAYDQLAPEYRSLSNATKMLPVNFTRWSRLKRWLRGDDSRVEGDYAYLFDHQQDRLSMQQKMGFDLTHFLDHEPANVLAAVSMYLFHRLEQTLTGQLVSVFLDEAWQYLDNPYWQAKLKTWLPTLRKLNCHLIFATQSPHSVARSAIRHIILDNCASHIYFANPQAKPEDYIDGFNLSEAEFNCIRENEPQSRLFLYKQGHQSTLARLNLSHLQDLLKIMSGTQQTVNLLTELRAQVGDDPEKWLPLFLQRSVNHDF